MNFLRIKVRIFFKNIQFINKDNMRLNLALELM